MSKPHKKRQHKCKSASGHPSKWENMYQCRTCGNKQRDDYPPNDCCQKCGKRNWIKIEKEFDMERDRKLI